ncbi:copper resistance protein CopC [Leifsonia shinshuensis]|uniref:Copper resistance protein CopC n=2 Tax=Leifsonia shinshuensis TaxID=150026 RepID=A0A7G6YH08_9MICO|nr:copper resistance protein CopC [Leifsonia shinshuensis]
MTTRVLAGAGLLAAVALALTPTVAASAHDYLVQTSPASGATQTEQLDQVKLTFNDRVLDLGGDGSSAILRVTDASGKHFETGCPTILDTTVSAPTALGAAGAYTVDWQVVSADGHTVSGSYGFTYKPPAGTAAVPGTTAPGCTSSKATPGAAPAPSSTASTAVPTKASSDGNLGLVIGIAIGIVALALIGVVILLLTRRKPPTES